MFAEQPPCAAAGFVEAAGSRRRLGFHAPPLSRNPVGIIAHNYEQLQI